MAIFGDIHINKTLIFYALVVALMLFSLIIYY